jgi:hypothetical protein
MTIRSVRLAIKWAVGNFVPRDDRCDGTGYSPNHKQAAYDEARFESNVLEHFGQPWVFGEKSLVDGKDFGQQGKGNALKTDQYGQRSIKQRVHIQDNTGNAPWPPAEARFPHPARPASGTVPDREKASVGCTAA